MLAHNDAGNGAMSDAVPLPQSPIGSPSRLSISKIQSPMRPPSRLPSVAATAAAGGRSVGTGLGSGKQSKYHRPGCIPQFVGEDILCDAGLAFLPPDYDASDEDETLEHWRAKYENGPGVTRGQMALSASKAAGRARQYARRSSSGSVGSIGSSGSLGGGGGISGSHAAGGSSSDQRYKSVVRYNGAPINLGTHQTSAAAVAMQDLANLALLGSEHDKKMQLLSRDEAWMALYTAKLPGVHPYGQVDQFSSLFSANYKPIFEGKLEDALSSIGGQDDMIAEVLCKLDKETERQAKASDASDADQLKRLRKYKEKQVTRRARRNKKLLKKNLAVKHRRVGPINTPRFQGSHGAYGVGDDGKIFWFRIKDNSEARQLKKTSCERRSNNTTAGDGDVEGRALDFGDVQDGAIVTPANVAIATNDNADNGNEDDAVSMTFSSSADDCSSVASSMSSVASSGRSGRVRVLPFDDFSANKEDSKVTSRKVRALGIPDAITITSTNAVVSMGEKNAKIAMDTVDRTTAAQTRNNEVNENNSNAPTEGVGEKGNHCPLPGSEGDVDPIRLLVSSVLASKKMGNANGDLLRVHAMLREFDVTPLLSFSGNGMKVCEGETNGKTLTGIKFKRKECDVSMGAALMKDCNGNNDFIIDVRVNAQASGEATPALTLR